jgi:hypothetical protein
MVLAHDVCASPDIRLASAKAKLQAMTDARDAGDFNANCEPIQPSILLRLAEFKAAVRHAVRDRPTAQAAKAIVLADLLVLAGVPDRHASKRLLCRYLTQHGYDEPLLHFLRTNLAEVCEAGFPKSLDELLGIAEDEARLREFEFACAQVGAQVGAPDCEQPPAQIEGQDAKNAADFISRPNGASAQLPASLPRRPRRRHGARVANLGSLLRRIAPLAVVIMLTLVGWLAYDAFTSRLGPTTDGKWVLYSDGSEVQAALDTSSFKKAGSRTLLYRTAWVIKGEGRSVVSLVSLDCASGKRESIARNTWDNRRFSGDSKHYSVAVVAMPSLNDVAGHPEHDILSKACQSI